MIYYINILVENLLKVEQTPEKYKMKNHNLSNEQIEFLKMIAINGGVAGCCCDAETLSVILEKCQDCRCRLANIKVST